MNNIIIQVINNDENLYDGDLRHYFKIIFSSPGIRNPYHNLRHYLHTTCSVYMGGKEMGYPDKYGKRAFRALLVAALFHDYDHSGKNGNDADEIKRAIAGFKNNILKEDADIADEIVGLIKATQYPHADDIQNSLGAALLCDADMSQNFSDVWMQQILIGLATEKEIIPINLLEKQIDFLPNISFSTDWAKSNYSEGVIREKIDNVMKLLDILRKDK